MKTPTLPTLALSLRLSPAGARLLVLMVALALALLLGSTAQLAQWENRLAEQAWTLNPETTPEERVVIVAIDEPSLAREGAWPWPRTTLARLAEQLDAEGAALQLYDIVLPESRPGDDRLAETLARVPAVLAQVPQLASAGTLRTGMMSDAVPGMRCQPPLPTTSSYLANHPDFGQLPKGHIAPRIAPDGVMRHQPVLVCVDGRVYPSLALRGLLHASSPDGRLAPGQLALSAAKRPFDPAWQLAIKPLGLSLPLDDGAGMRLSYRASPDAFSVISASDVLAGEVPDGWLDNAWVLIGATAFGLGDYLPGPHAAMTPGVELQARLVTSMLDQQVPYTPAIAPWLQAVSLILLALLLLWLAARPGRASFIGLPLVGVGLPVALLGTHHLLLLNAGWWLGWMLPALFAMIASVLLLLLEYGRARLERLRLFVNLSSYLPEPVAREIAFHQPSGAVDAHRQTLTVLCTDLRNFASLQDALPPEDAAAVLHGFFVAATRLVEQEGGSVHEFKGDSLIAIWPAAEDDRARSAERALTAGTRLINEVPARLPAHLPAGLVPLGVGVGIEQGSALMGSIGPAHRRHHSLLGRPVTLALRIQAMTAEIGQPILIGEQAAALLSRSLDDQGSYLLEGVQKPQRLFTLPADQLPDVDLSLGADAEPLENGVTELRLIKG